eukprot:3979870-Prymnesium_polylepis.1
MCIRDRRKLVEELRQQVARLVLLEPTRAAQASRERKQVPKAAVKDVGVGEKLVLRHLVDGDAPMLDWISRRRRRRSPQPSPLLLRR